MTHSPEDQHRDVVYGVNPVREALRAGLPIDRAYTCKASGHALPLIGEIKEKHRVPVIEIDAKRMQALCAEPEQGREANHQGIAVVLAAAAYQSVDDLLARAEERGEEPLLVLLDGITDPHNFGAILRSAEALGAHGVLIPKRRSASLSGTAFRASSGAAAHIGVARVSNLVSTMKELKEKGFWLAGTDALAPPAAASNLTGPLVLCIGSEGEGLSRLVRQTCDFMVGIPLSGQTQSLNASCAAAILLYEASRQRALRSANQTE